MSSIYTQLGQKVQKPIAIALGLGVTASSFMLFTNVGMATVGVMPAVSDAEKRKRANLTAGQAARLWAHHYRTATPLMVSNVVVGTLSYCAAAHFSPALRPVLYPAAATLALVSITTVTIILPINNQLLAYADKQTIAESDLTVAQVSDIDSLLDQWRILNLWRLSFSTISFTLGLGAALFI